MSTTAGLMMSEKPIILISSSRSAQEVGDAASNGGMHLYHLWGKLLRQHGYESFLVTYDGSRVDWLIDPIPYISLDDMRQMQQSGRECRYLTGWLWASAFIDSVPNFYFYDCELAFTSDYSKQRGILDRLIQQQKITKIGTNSRLHVGWYKAAYNLLPQFIGEWSDTSLWKPCPEKRVKGRIGYFWEGDHTNSDMAVLTEACTASGVEAEFIRVHGSEAEVLATLQTCDLFVGLNLGKWDGIEGCPRTGNEAQHAGAVVVAYNVWGNTEYLMDGFNGYIVRNGDTVQMADRVVELLMRPIHKETMRTHSIDYAMGYFNAEMRWEAVARFLDLETA